MTKADLIEALSKIDRTSLPPKSEIEVFPIPDELIITDEDEDEVEELGNLYKKDVSKE